MKTWLFWDWWHIEHQDNVALRQGRPRWVREATYEDPVFDYVLMNSAPVEGWVLQRYRASGADVVEPDYTEVARMGLIPVRADLVSVSADGWVRHDVEVVARKLVALYEERAPVLV